MILVALVLAAAPPVPPVSGRMFPLGGRLELTPSLGISLGDAFFQKASVGGRAAWHLGDEWAIGVHAAKTLSRVAAPLAVCADSLECSAPEATRLSQAPGDLFALASAEVEWSPLYGKLSLLAEAIVHFDVHVSLGPAVAMYRIGDQLQLGAGGRATLGERVYLGPRTALNLELSELVYRAEIRGSPAWEPQAFFSLGMTWLFGGR